MISLDKIKVLFLDFDDTTCIHLYDKVHRDDEAYIKAIYTGDKSYYLNTDLFAVQNDVKAFASLCHMSGIVVNGLTWDTTYLPYVPKKAFLDEHLAGVVDELYVAGCRERKLEIIENYCSVYGINKDEVLMIDDHPETIHMLTEAGIHAMSPITLTADLSKVFDLSNL